MCCNIHNNLITSWMGTEKTNTSIFNWAIFHLYYTISTSTTNNTSLFQNLIVLTLPQIWTRGKKKKKKRKKKSYQNEIFTAMIVKNIIKYCFKHYKSLLNIKYNFIAEIAFFGLFFVINCALLTKKQLISTEQSE